MPELSELERRRQKRQQKILASAGDRLNKITGTAYPDKKTPTPSPSASMSSYMDDSLRAPSHSRSPSPAVFGMPTSSTSTESLKRSMRRSSDDDPGEELGAPPRMDASPLAASEGPFGMPNELFGGQFPFNPAMLAGMNQQQQQQTAEADTTEKYWNLLHFISMVWLGCYAVYSEWARVGTERFTSLLFTNPAQTTLPAIHVPVFWYFITLELCLQSARMLYHKGAGSSNSTLGALAAQLPSPFGDIITVLLRYRLIWSCLVQDCCVLVFVIGLAVILSPIIPL